LRLSNSSPKKSLQKHLARNYKYIHFGLVQVEIKLLTKEGLNTSILDILRDARFHNFQESLLNSIKSSLCSGPVSFDCYSNLTISLKDKNILQSMLLQIKTHNYHMLEGSILVALIFKIDYKNTFLTRVMLREDSNQSFWKEKFIAGLPILLGEKVRNKIKAAFTTKTIPYDQLTYGELVSFTKKKKVLRSVRISNSKNT